MARRATRDERGAQCYMALRIAPTAASLQEEIVSFLHKGAAAVGWRWRARLVIHALRGLREGGSSHTDWQSAAARYRMGGRASERDLYRDRNRNAAIGGG